MLAFSYETNRMYLRVLNDTAFKEVGSFYYNNIGIFDLSEPLNPESFSDDYFKSILRYEYQAILKSMMVRYWAISKAEPGRVIGTVSFRNLRHQFFHSCDAGYKIDRDYQNLGYGKELVSFGVNLMERELNIHRIEATVLPDNIPSIKLLEGLDFNREGLLREKIFIKGEWRDHYLYARIKNEK